MPLQTCRVRSTCTCPCARVARCRGGCCGGRCTSCRGRHRTGGAGMHRPRSLHAPLVRATVQGAILVTACSASHTLAASPGVGCVQRGMNVVALGMHHRPQPLQLGTQQRDGCIAAATSAARARKSRSCHLALWCCVPRRQCPCVPAVVAITAARVVCGQGQAGMRARRLLTSAMDHSRHRPATCAIREQSVHVLQLTPGITRPGCVPVCRLRRAQAAGAGKARPAPNGCRPPHTVVDASSANSNLTAVVEARRTPVRHANGCKLWHG
jgi:hypothetical protein